jgi:alkylated DNA repair protein (DNA oxidative demethylase)
MAVRPFSLRGFSVFQGFLDRALQMSLLEDLRGVMRAAPPFTPQTPFGKPMSVRMTSAGNCGWYSDASGYRYIDRHPGGGAWPDIPVALLDIWNAVSGVDRQPDSCLINFYGEGARMSMHQDRDEAGFCWPVVSVSLGDDGLLRVGGVEKGGRTETLWLSSGDVVVMGGAARLAWHGIDKIRFASSRLLPRGGRVNVTLRVVR